MKRIAFLIVAVAIGFASCEKDESVFALDGIDNVSTTDRSLNSSQVVIEGNEDSGDANTNQIFTDTDGSKNYPTRRDEETL